MFRRGEASPPGGGGLGIGLALSRKLAELHGGTLDAQSDGIGRGSAFTLKLPIVAPFAAAVERAAGMTVDLREMPTPTANGNGTAQRVLVVDDNRDAADSLGMVLRMLGAHVDVVSDGPSALEAFDAKAPEVVLLDIGMPGMDGYEVARGIRARDPARRTAIVALTGWGQDTDRRRARDAGFDHHLVKPADMGVLQRLLTTLRDRAPDGSAST
jgi:CheY-like chemotaxis protein